MQIISGFIFTSTLPPEHTVKAVLLVTAVALAILTAVASCLTCLANRCFKPQKLEENKLDNKVNDLGEKEILKTEKKSEKVDNFYIDSEIKANLNKFFEGSKYLIDDLPIQQTSGDRFPYRSELKNSIVKGKLTNGAVFVAAKVNCDKEEDLLILFQYQGLKWKYRDLQGQFLDYENHDIDFLRIKTLLTKGVDGEDSIPEF